MGVHLDDENEDGSEGKSRRGQKLSPQRFIILEKPSSFMNDIQNTNMIITLRMELSA